MKEFTLSYDNQTSSTFHTRVYPIFGKAIITSQPGDVILLTDSCNGNKKITIVKNDIIEAEDYLQYIEVEGFMGLYPYFYSRKQDFFDYIGQYVSELDIGQQTDNWNDQEIIYLIENQ